jgi:hypothetical protein
MKLEKLACAQCGASLTGNIAPNQKIECGSCGTAYLVTDLTEPDVVICPQCRTINGETKRYCAHCGQALKISCVLCYTENPIGSSHCLNCGAHLEKTRTRRDTLHRARERHRLAFLERLKDKEARQQAEKLQGLLDALDEPKNHDMAIFQINQLGEAAIAPLIGTLLNDADPDARYGSARALGHICQEHDIKTLIKAKAAQALIKALADLEPAVRYWACDALGKCQSQIAIDPLAALRSDPHEGVRHCAKAALQQIGGERVAEILAEAGKSKGMLGWIKGK